MNIDIPLAGWLLSFLTFLVGLLPTIYERLSHQGYAIKPVWELKTISQDIDDKNKVRLGIVLKVANAKDKALLIESVTTEKPRIKIKSTLIVHSETIIRTLDLPKDNTKSTKIIYSVLTSGQQDYLPTIIRPQEEKYIGIYLTYSIQPLTDSDLGFVLFTKHIMEKGIGVLFQINGKNVRYKIKLNEGETEPVIMMSQQDN